MSKKVLIASDSTTDLSAELIERYGIKTVPLTVNLGEKSYTDGVDVNPDMIYAHYEEKGELPKTAAPNVADFCDFFEKYTSEGYDIVLFTISAEMSSTFNNARLASEEFDGVYAVDTRNLSTGGGLVLIRAAEMAEEGLSAAEIAKEALRTGISVREIILRDGILTEEELADVLDPVAMTEARRLTK